MRTRIKRDKRLVYKGRPVVRVEDPCIVAENFKPYWEQKIENNLRRMDEPVPFVNLLAPSEEDIIMDALDGGYGDRYGY